MTNALIRVEGLKGVSLYKHGDGGSDTLKNFLEKFNIQYEKHRPKDPYYKMAQLIRATTMIDKEPVLNWGVYDHSNVHVDYRYLLKMDGTVEVNKITPDY